MMLPTSFFRPVEKGTKKFDLMQYFDASDLPVYGREVP